MELATAEPTTHEMDDAWTSDSERQAESGQALTSDPVTSGTVVGLDDDDTAPVAASEPVSTEPTTPEPPKRRNPRNDPRARVEQATAQAAAAKEEARIERERAARLEAELQQARAARSSAPVDVAPAPPPAAQNGKFPTFDVWAESHPGADYDDYVDARADARAEAKIAAFQQAMAAEQEALVIQARFEEGLKKYPDLPQIVQASNNPPLSAVMHEAIRTSEAGPDLVYWLATHPDQCRQLAEESRDEPVGAVRTMRRYLETLAQAAAITPDSAPQARPSAALPPVNRVGGTATATPVDPDDLPFGPDYIRAENARDRKRQERRW